MRWICEQEGIQADDEALGILAQAGEGSVRDSLSALDQAIACCGTTLAASDIRQLLGLFSQESLKEVAEALQTPNTARMLEIVGELERNGRSLHHFCRELSRYFRNLLVARITGSESRLISASGPEQARLLETASQFTEEDLTRYLQLTLDLYKDLQASLQPRLHLEMGLLRLVHAGRLVSIEKALASVGGSSATATVAAQAPKPAALPQPPARTGPSPFERDIARKPSPAPTAPAPPVKLPDPTSAAAPAPALAKSAASEPARDQLAQATENGDLRTRLITALQEMDRPFVVDNLEVATVVENGGELVITAPREACTMLRFSEGDLAQAVKRVFGKPLRLKFVEGAGTESAAPRVSAPRRSDTEEEVIQRVMADPAVKSFREAFPDAEIRQVRNLKEQENP